MATSLRSSRNSVTTPAQLRTSFLLSASKNILHISTPVSSYLSNQLWGFCERTGNEPPHKAGKTFCSRCEISLEPGVTCSVRTTQLRSRKRKSKLNPGGIANEVSYICKLCGHKNNKRGSPLRYVASKVFQVLGLKKARKQSRNLAAIENSGIKGSRKSAGSTTVTDSSNLADSPSVVPIFTPLSMSGVPFTLTLPSTPTSPLNPIKLLLSPIAATPVSPLNPLSDSTPMPTPTPASAPSNTFEPVPTPVSLSTSTSMVEPFPDPLSAPASISEPIPTPAASVFALNPTQVSIPAPRPASTPISAPVPTSAPSTTLVSVPASSPVFVSISASIHAPISSLMPVSTASPTPLSGSASTANSILTPCPPLTSEPTPTLEICITRDESAFTAVPFGSPFAVAPPPMSLELQANSPEVLSILDPLSPSEQEEDEMNADASLGSDLSTAFGSPISVAPYGEPTWTTLKDDCQTSHEEVEKVKENQGKHSSLPAGKTDIKDMSAAISDSKPPTRAILRSHGSSLGSALGRLEKTRPGSTDQIDKLSSFDSWIHKEIIRVESNGEVKTGTAEGRQAESMSVWRDMNVLIESCVTEAIEGDPVLNAETGVFERKSEVMTVREDEEFIPCIDNGPEISGNVEVSLDVIMEAQKADECKDHERENPPLPSDRMFPELGVGGTVRPAEKCFKDVTGATSAVEGSIEVNALDSVTSRDIAVPEPVEENGLKTAGVILNFAPAEDTANKLPVLSAKEQVNGFNADEIMSEPPLAEGSNKAPCDAVTMEAHTGETPEMVAELLVGKRSCELHGNTVAGQSSVVAQMSADVEGAVNDEEEERGVQELAVDRDSAGKNVAFSTDMAVKAGRLGGMLVDVQKELKQLMSERDGLKSGLERERKIVQTLRVKQKKMKALLKAANQRLDKSTRYLSSARAHFFLASQMRSFPNHRVLKYKSQLLAATKKLRKLQKQNSDTMAQPPPATATPAPSSPPLGITEPHPPHIGIKPIQNADEKAFSFATLPSAATAAESQEKVGLAPMAVPALVGREKVSKENVLKETMVAFRQRKGGVESIRAPKKYQGKRQKKDSSMDGGQASGDVESVGGSVTSPEQGDEDVATSKLSLQKPPEVLLDPVSGTEMEATEDQSGFAKMLPFFVAGSLTGRNKSTHELGLFDNPTLEPQGNLAGISVKTASNQSGLPKMPAKVSLGIAKKQMLQMSELKRGMKRPTGMRDTGKETGDMSDDFENVEKSLDSGCDGHTVGLNECVRLEWRKYGRKWRTVRVSDHH